MDAIERLKGLRTAVKVCFNILERLEAKSTDWEVGVKCQSDEKAVWVHRKLSEVLSELANDYDFQIVKDDNVVKVLKQATKLRVLSPDKEESGFAKALLEALPESPQSEHSSSTSSLEEVDTDKIPLA